MNNYKNYNNKMSPERYLANKEYFDKSLIDLLERQAKQIDKYKELEDIYKATIYKLKAKVKTLGMKLKIQNKEDNLLDKAYKQIEKLLAENEKLKAENKIMKEELSFFKLRNVKLEKDNTNSNVPSSYIMFKANANNRNKTDKHVGGQIGHPVHKSKLLKPDKIIIKHVEPAPAGAVVNYDENGKFYFTTQEIDMKFKTIIIETRYYIKQDGKELNAKILSKYKINPATYSDGVKKQVLYLYSKGIIALDRLSKMMNVLSDDRLSTKPSTIVSWIHEYALNHQDEQKDKLQRLLNSEILHVDESGYRVNGKPAWIHSITNGTDTYFQMTNKRSEFLPVIKDYKGTLIHDHFKPYYSIDCKHGECNAHILRYLKAGVDFYNNMACAKMISLLQLSLHKKKQLIKQGIYEYPPDELTRIEKDYDDIIDNELINFYNDNPNIKKKYVPEYIKTLQRMKEYKKEHLLFLHNFDVPFDNNLAERSIRLIKTRKKVSGQVKSIENGNEMLVLLACF